MRTLDMRTKPCPIPVIQARKAFDEGADSIIVLVDNIIAVQNLQKMAKGLGYEFAEERRDDFDFAVTIRSNGEAGVAAQKAAISPKKAATGNSPSPADSAGATVLITCDQMGRGSEELGKILIKGFIFALTQLPVLPEAVLLLNSGVRLAVDDANTVDDLKALEQGGVAVRACGTCLNYYNLLDKLAVGEVADMMQITERLTSSAKAVVL